jgi:hypothetical protein
MKTLSIIQLIVCVAASGWFTTAAYKGWKTPTVMSQQSGTGGTHPTGGYYHRSYIFGGWGDSSGGSRSTGGSWGGGK